jgi:hypothetical protein
MVILVVISSRGGMPAHFSLVYLFYQFMGYSALSGLTAFLFYFWVEAPFGELERLLFHRRAAGGGRTLLQSEKEKEVEALSGPVGDDDDRQAVVIVPVAPVDGRVTVAQ